jgi:hypothetical protein
MIGSLSFQLEPEDTVIRRDCEGRWVEQCVFRWTKGKFAAIGTKLKI